ncbi:MAG: sialidase family protein [Myxococcales bacterium]
MNSMKSMMFALAFAGISAGGCGDDGDSHHDVDAGDGDDNGGADGGMHGDGDIQAGDGDGNPANPDGGGGGDGDVAIDGGVSGVATGVWTNVTNNLKGITSSCGNVYYMAAKPTEDKLIVGIAKQGYYASSNGGMSWQKLGTGAGSASLGGTPNQIVFDPEHADTFWTANTWGAPAVLGTTDDGVTFKKIFDMFAADSVSVDFTDPARKTLLAGAHEMTQTVWRSTDGGATWNNVGVNLPAGSNHSSYAHVVDSQIHLMGVTGWAGGQSGIFRTADGGAHWDHVSDDGGGSFPLKHSDGSIYWADRDQGGMMRSTDKGATWKPSTVKNTVYPIAPIELPDGRIATRSSKGVIVSADHGTSWTVVAPPEPFDDPHHIFALSYSKYHKAFYVAQWTCADGPIPDNAVAAYGWDYEAK